MGYFALNTSTGQITVTSTGSAALNGSANAISCNVTVTAANAIETSNAELQTINTYADGSPGAPSGAAQYSTALSGYGLRTPWKVAGVDYLVGYATAPVKDPSTFTPLPSGASFSGNTITLAGTGGTFDGYDFSLHGGMAIQVTASGWTISNCHFLYGPTQLQYALIGGSSGVTSVTLLNNIIDGFGDGPGGTNVSAHQGALVSGPWNGTFTAKYNWFRRWDQHRD